MTGTGESKAMCGQLNQRRAIAALASGVQTLTARMANSAASKHACPARRARSCTSPSVFSTSQPAPSSP